MGWTTEGDKKPKKYFKLTNPKGNVSKGLYFTEKVNGEYEKVFINSLEGEIIDIKKVLNKPKEGQSWNAHYTYQITLEDPSNAEQDLPTLMILSLTREARTTDRIILLLASVEQPRRIKIGAFKQRESPYYLTIWMHNNGEKVSPKYPWDKEKGDYAEVPKVKAIPTGVFDEVTEEEKINYDRRERSAFLEELLKKAAYVITGQVWTGANVVGDNSSNVSNKPAAEETPSSKIYTGVTKNYKDAPALLAAWSKIAPKIKSDVEKEDDRALLKANITTYLNSLSSEMYVLNADGTYGVDDLPF
jgi:hypothetical protein